MNLFGINFNPAQFIQDFIGNLFRSVVTNTVHSAQTTGQGLIHFFQTFFTIITSLPPEFTYNVAGIQPLWGMFRDIAVALLALIAVIAGLQMMIGRATGIEYIPPGVFIPRIIGAFLACNVSFTLCQMFIDLANAVTQTVLTFTGQFAGPGVIITLLTTAAAALLTGGILDILLLILFSIFFIFFLRLFFQACARLFLINLLIVLSPLGIIAWVLPQTKKWAAFWLNLFVATIMEVVAQVIVLCLVFIIMFSATRKADILAQLIIASSGILLVTRVPQLLARMGGTGGHADIGSAVGNMIGGAISLAGSLAAAATGGAGSGLAGFVSAGRRMATDAGRKDNGGGDVTDKVKTQPLPKVGGNGAAASSTGSSAGGKGASSTGSSAVGSGVSNSTKHSPKFVPNLARNPSRTGNSSRIGTLVSLGPESADDIMH